IFSVWRASFPVPFRVDEALIQRGADLVLDARLAVPFRRAGERPGPSAAAKDARLPVEAERGERRMVEADRRHVRRAGGEHDQRPLQPLRPKKPPAASGGPRPPEPHHAGDRRGEEEGPYVSRELALTHALADR